MISDGHIIDLDCTSAHHLVTDSKPGVHTTIQINDADAWRGDMIGLDTDPNPTWGHIANVEYIEVDDHNEIENLEIYKAKGHINQVNPGPMNLVRHVNGKFYYLDRGYKHKCIRWDYGN